MSPKKLLVNDASVLVRFELFWRYPNSPEVQCVSSMSWPCLALLSAQIHFPPFLNQIEKEKLTRRRIFKIKRPALPSIVSAIRSLSDQRRNGMLRIIFLISPWCLMYAFLISCFSFSDALNDEFNTIKKSFQITVDLKNKITCIMHFALGVFFIGQY